MWSLWIFNANYYSLHSFDELKHLLRNTFSPKYTPQITHGAHAPSNGRTGSSLPYASMSQPLLKGEFAWKSRFTWLGNQKFKMLRLRLWLPQRHQKRATKNKHTHTHTHSGICMKIDARKYFGCCCCNAHIHTDDVVWEKRAFSSLAFLGWNFHLCSAFHFCRT